MELSLIRAKIHIFLKTFLACILLIFSTKVLPVLKLPEILPSNCSSVFLGGLHAHKGLSGLQNKNYFGKFYKNSDTSISPMLCASKKGLSGLIKRIHHIDHASASRMETGRSGLIAWLLLISVLRKLSSMQRTS